jgi:hypothetical protein
MTDAGPLPRVERGRLATLATNPILLWGGFVVVHFWLGLLGLAGPGLPLGDVTFVYKFWVQHGIASQQWVGLDTPWVYPIVALLPMIAAYAFGPAVYDGTWLSLVMVIDAAGFAVIMAFGRDRRLAHVAWWWLGLLLFLGPVALGRVDSVTAPIAIVGMLSLASAPRLAGVLLAVATWITVWPASAVIVVGALLLGGGRYLLSFVTQQTGRGLQIESGIGTFWMWDSFLHPERTSIYYDSTILTYQLLGPGVEVAAAVATPLIATAVAGLLVVALVATRRGVPAAELLPPLALAITTALILFNKVGSPQFVTWLAVPIVLGLATAATGRGMSFRVPATLALAIALLTQLIYPNLYQELLQSNPLLLLVLSARNLLYVALFVWAVVALLGLIRSGAAGELVDDGLPRVWPFGPPPADGRERVEKGAG